MNKELKFVTVFPSDNYFTWQCHVWLESLKKLNLSDKAIILIFTPNGRDEHRERFKQIIDLYPEAEFNFYKDEHNVSALLGIYISVLRPYTAWRYWTDHPEMKDKAIFYCDSDILFTEKFDIQQFLDDDINYLSDTNSYINVDYFDSKLADVLPNKLDEYKKRDILQETANLVGINRKICTKNNLHSGGAQYLLKNLDADYWDKVMTDCISIRKYLSQVNKEFFKDENSGYQSWCADMWAVLWNLWLREQETKVVPELAFAWATDPIQRIETCTIFHNAGIGADMQDGHPCFYKGKYHQGKDPFMDRQIDIVLNNNESKKFCTWYYAKALKDLYNKYQLQY
jgi:hypothetical protein